MSSNHSGWASLTAVCTNGYCRANRAPGGRGVVDDGVHKTGREGEHA